MATEMVSITIRRVSNGYIVSTVDGEYIADSNYGVRDVVDKIMTEMEKDIYSKED